MRERGRRYTDYDAFARLYDRHWGGKVDRHLEVLDAHVLPGVPAGARLLDLCCGTGQLAAVLADRGYRVAGLDGSDAMLERARANAPAVDFVAADARDFSFPEPFDGVVCTYDSLNHVMEEAELARVFACVARALVPGGVFAFDLNLEAKYRETWTGDYHVVDDDQVGVFRSSADPDARRAFFDATILYRRQEDIWTRHDLHLEQTWYDEPVVAARLVEAGFLPPEAHAKQTLKRDPGVALNRLYVARRAT